MKITSILTKDEMRHLEATAEAALVYFEQYRPWARPFWATNAHDIKMELISRVLNMETYGHTGSDSGQLVVRKVVDSEEGSISWKFYIEPTTRERI